MTTNENGKPKRKLKRWQFTLLIILALLVIGSIGGNESSTNGSSSTTASAPKADLGTRAACERWRENLSNASVETRAQQIEGAQKVNREASISTNPTIVEYGRKMTEAMLDNDAEAYLAYGTIFGQACITAGA